LDKSTLSKIFQTPVIYGWGFLLFIVFNPPWRPASDEKVLVNLLLVGSPMLRER
jgi:hypothetical protein